MIDPPSGTSAHASLPGGPLPLDTLAERALAAALLLDEGADLYAFGATFYEWATGRLPFEERDPLRLVREQLTRAPVAPITLRPELPRLLSDVIVRLLEKEPERRYHAIEGLVHDLKRLRGAARRGKPALFTPGDRDFPAQLSPLHLVGREHEVEQLRSALDAAASGECRVVLVSGAAGVGKSALVNELRALAAARNGRFVAGKFDQPSRDDPSAIFGALGALGRLLLTEPNDELAAQRQRILQEVGPQAALACAIPEFKLLLGDLPEPSAVDPAHVVPRLGKMILDLLRAIASPARPLVMVLDDVQWSRGSTGRLIESVLARGAFPGLVLVCAFREGEPSPPHTFSAPSTSGSKKPYPLQYLRLGNLADNEIAQMLAPMLRLSARQALPLAQALAPHAGGNPYDTVELVNALRRDGLLAPRAKDWRWNPAALQRYIGSAEVMDLLEARISRLPRDARELLQTLACVRNEVSPMLVRVACGLAKREFETHLAALTEQGLVSRAAGPPPLLRVLHDRVQQAAYGSLAEARRVELHLTVARRLAVHGGFEPVCASQYVAAADAVRDPAECVLAAALLRDVATAARATGNHAGARRMLEPAVSLLARAAAAGQGNAELRYACDVDQHLTFYGLGKLDEADAVYQRIVASETDPLRLVDAACVQVRSLCNRGDAAQGTALALRFLRDLGFEVPERLDRSGLAPGFERLRRWVETFDPTREQARDEARQPHVIAAAKMMARLCAPAFLMDDAGLASWLVIESQALWEQHGPCAPLVVILCRANLVCAAQGDMSIGYLLGRSLLAFSEAKGWDAERWQCLDLFAVNSIHWFEPVEQSLQQAARAREGLLSSGDLQNACLSYRASIVAAFESAPTLDAFAQEVRAGLDIAQRAANSQAQIYFAPELQLLRALRGETVSTGSFDGDGFSEARYLIDNAALPRAILSFHLRRTVACAIFGDAQGLSAHAGASLKLLNFHSYYPTAWAYWLAGLAAAWQLQHAMQAAPQDVPHAPDAGLVRELDSSLEWLACRAKDAPFNFGHMHLHLQAERAWALGDPIAAAQYFDQALGQVAVLPRPWHRALVTERAGRFQLAQGRSRGGRQLLTQARQLYEAWGASSKAAQLGAAVGMRGAAVNSAAGGVARSHATDDLDTLAVLRASHALSSERSPARLKTRVEEVLGSMTGATRVVLALWDEDAREWVLREADGSEEGAIVSLSAAALLLPLTAFRYAERTREPLLLADAVADDRFGRDAYFQGMERCSLMVVPILHQGMMRAMLVLENRASRGAFSAVRLDAVMMIAGQLAVSLESAQLYERLERKVREQTQQLREAQSRLVDEARRAGMAQIATNVLHNVGNVLTSVNVSTHVLATQVRQSRAARVSDLAQLLENNAAHLAHFFEVDEKGRMLPGYLRELAQALEVERGELLGELERLSGSVDHIKNVVAMQQSYAGASGVLESCNIIGLVDDALRIQQDSLARHGVAVSLDCASVEAVPLDKTRVMQILVNLIENSRQAMEAVPGERKLEVAVHQEAGWLSVSIADNGCGIAADHLERIFSHGFTTKAGGHGFGLHSCVVAAQEMGGTLGVHSDGANKGATFTLRLPLHAAAAA